MGKCLNSNKYKTDKKKKRNKNNFLKYKINNNSVCTEK